MSDREKVIKKAERIMCSTVDRDMIDSFCEDVIALLKEQPEIVRCKDCEHYTGGFDGYCNRWFRRAGGEMAFCSCGIER